MKIRFEKQEGREIIKNYVEKFMLPADFKVTDVFDLSYGDYEVEVEQPKKEAPSEPA